MTPPSDTAEAKVRRYHGYFVMDLNSNVVQRGNDVVLASDYDALEARCRELEIFLDDSERLARLFHDTYERLAPDHGYVTRTDTRVFDRTSRNGQLMIQVCCEIARAALTRGPKT